MKIERVSFLPFLLPFEELTIPNLKIKGGIRKNRGGIIIAVVEANLSEKKLLLFFFSLSRAIPPNWVIPKL